jgi:hypothetical protein
MTTSSLLYVTSKYICDLVVFPSHTPSDRSNLTASKLAGHRLIAWSCWIPCPISTAAIWSPESYVSAVLAAAQFTSCWKVIRCFFRELWRPIHTGLICSIVLSGFLDSGVHWRMPHQLALIAFSVWKTYPKEPTDHRNYNCSRQESCTNSATFCSRLDRSWVFAAGPCPCSRITLTCTTS